MQRSRRPATPPTQDEFTEACDALTRGLRLCTVETSWNNRVQKLGEIQLPFYRPSWTLVLWGWMEETIPPSPGQCVIPWDHTYRDASHALRRFGETRAQGLLAPDCLWYRVLWTQPKELAVKFELLETVDVIPFYRERNRDFRPPS